VSGAAIGEIVSVFGVAWSGIHKARAARKKCIFVTIACLIRFSFSFWRRAGMCFWPWCFCLSCLVDTLQTRNACLDLRFKTFSMLGHMCLSHESMQQTHHHAHKKRKSVSKERQSPQTSSNINTTPTRYNTIDRKNSKSPTKNTINRTTLQRKTTTTLTTTTTPRPNATNQAYGLIIMTFKSINLVLTAAFIVFVLYKMLTHLGGAVRGLGAAHDAVVLLLVGIVGTVVELVMALLRRAERDLTMLA
jgi:hypothetical protein